MGLGSKITSVVFRVIEFISAVVVAALLGRYLYLLDLANTGGNSRVIYAEVIAGLSIFFSLILIPPVRYSFYAFPLDFSLFICWMVAFGLLDNLSGGRTCSSVWYWNSWGYYWGGFWHTIPRNAITASTVGSIACGKWRSTLAFSFIGGFFWLGSAILGLYVIATRSEHTAVGADQANTAEDTVPGSPHKRHWFTKEKPAVVPQS